MFNGPTMECTKDKQLAMDPHRNRWKMSETVGTWTQEEVTRCIGALRKGGGANGPRWDKHTT